VGYSPSIAFKFKTLLHYRFPSHRFVYQHHYSERIFRGQEGANVEAYIRYIANVANMMGLLRCYQLSQVKFQCGIWLPLGIVLTMIIGVYHGHRINVTVVRFRIVEIIRQLLNYVIIRRSINCMVLASFTNIWGRDISILIKVW
jgi:hypothetical protein